MLYMYYYIIPLRINIPLILLPYYHTNYMTQLLLILAVNILIYTFIMF